jgi:hypothetical protein
VYTKSTIGTEELIWQPEPGVTALKLEVASLFAVQ